MSVLLAAVEPPGGEEGGGARGGVDGGVAEPLGAEQQQLVVAHQRLAVAAGGGGLGGQLHHEVDDADAVRAAVGEVAEEPEPGGARGPVAVRVDQALLVERGHAARRGSRGRRRRRTADPGRSRSASGDRRRVEGAPGSVGPMGDPRVSMAGRVRARRVTPAASPETPAWRPPGRAAGLARVADRRLGPASAASLRPAPARSGPVSWTYAACLGSVARRRRPSACEPGSRDRPPELIDPSTRSRRIGAPVSGLGLVAAVPRCHPPIIGMLIVAM